MLIVSWNTKDLLDACLASVKQGLVGINNEIIVVDNASADGTPVLLSERHPDVRAILNKENVGFAKATNQALRQASGDYVVLLNSDTTVTTDALAKMMSFLRGNEGVGCVGPLTYYPDGRTQRSAGRFPTVWSDICEYFYLDRVFPKSTIFAGYYFGSRDFDKERDVDWVSGSCMMMTNKAVRAIGELDEQFFMYSEEIDYCYRIKQAGYRVIFTPTAEIVHYEGKSSEQRPVWAIAALHKSKYIYEQKHFSTGRMVASKTVALAGLAFRITFWSLRKLFSGNKNGNEAHTIMAHKQLMAWHLGLGKG